MKTLIIGFIALLLALSPNVGGALLDRFEREMDGNSLPTSRQQVNQQVESQLFGDFDSLMSSIG